MKLGILFLIYVMHEERLNDDVCKREFPTVVTANVSLTFDICGS